MILGEIRSAGGGGGKPDPVYDVTIRSQAEFEALYNSPTWLDAKSVLFVGDGGTLKFARSDGTGLRIPQTVKNIKGINSATIEVTNFVRNLSTNRAALWYETLPATNDYSIDGLTINCTGAAGSTVTGICQCIQVINCSSTSTGVGSDWASSYGFYSCNTLINCRGKATGTGNSGFAGASGSGFSYCNQLTNCTGLGISTGVGATGYSNGKGLGFESCNQLLNCIGTGDGANISEEGFGFQYCTQLLNCTGVCINCYFGFGFCECKQLDNCTSIFKQPISSNTYGFGDCTQLSNCIADGGNVYTSGACFYSCSYLNGCKQGDTPSTTSFLGGTNTKVDTVTVVAT